MKRKTIFIGMVLLALVLTSGTFAYTYTSYGTTTLGADIIDAVMTTCEPSADQPPWESILPEGEYNSEILLPAAAGDATELPTQFPLTGEHWDKVDDLPADDGDTYVSTAGSRQWEKDLYNLTNYIGAGGSEKIMSVTVYFRFAAGGSYTVRAMAEIKTNGEVFSGDTESLSGTEFVTKSHQWTDNPATDAAWTWEEISDLQAGVTMKGKSKTKPALCTQVYVEVNYEVLPIIEGLVPDGDLYVLTPHPENTGDLMVKIYLTNTSSLLKSYQYLNMKLKIEGSVEAQQIPDYQILSMENGVVIFNIEGGSAESYTVEVKGGSYRVISGEPAEWVEGWSVTPEFYCEVTQR